MGHLGPVGAHRRRSARQVLVRPTVPISVPSGIAKRDFGHSAQDVCSHNVKFSEALAPAGGVHPRVQQVADEAGEAAGLERNAAVMLGNVGTSRDVDVLARALDDAEPHVREHAAWALGAPGSPPTPPPTGRPAE